MVDRDSRSFFASNWLYYFMLTEIEMYSLRRTGAKFFLSFDSGGVDLDRRRGIVYVSKGFSGVIFGLDRRSFEVVHRIDTRPFVRAVCADEKRNLVYAGNVIEPYVYVYRPGGKPVGKIFTGSNCREIVVAPKSGRVFAGTAFGLIELRVDKLISDSKAGQ